MKEEMGEERGEILKDQIRNFVTQRRRTSIDIVFV